MKSSAYPLSIDNLYYMDYPPPLPQTPFSHNDLELPHSINFQKFQPNYNKNKDSRHKDILRSICANIYE